MNSTLKVAAMGALLAVPGISSCGNETDTKRHDEMGALARSVESSGAGGCRSAEDKAQIAQLRVLLLDLNEQLLLCIESQGESAQDIEVEDPKGQFSSDVWSTEKGNF